MYQLVIGLSCYNETSLQIDRQIIPGSDDENALDLEMAYETIRKAIRNNFRPVKVSKFEPISMNDVEGKEIAIDYKNLNDHHIK